MCSLFTVVVRELYFAKEDWERDTLPLAGYERARDQILEGTAGVQVFDNFSKADVCTKAHRSRRRTSGATPALDLPYLDDLSFDSTPDAQAENLHPLVRRTPPEAPTALLAKIWYSPYTMNESSVPADSSASPGHTVSVIQTGATQAMEPRERAITKPFALIDRFPNEILSTIFMSFLPNCFPDSPQKTYAWVSVIRVCRRWYDVAVHVAALWAYIYLPCDNAVVELLLKRAKDAPLYLTYDYRNSKSIAVVKDLLKDHLYHIRHLDLCINPVLFEEIRGTLSKPAPKLSIWSMGSWESGDNIVEPYLDHETMPSLRVFRTYGMCTVPWAKLSRMSTLRELNIKHYHADANITLSTVLDALTGIPLLEELHLTVNWMVVGNIARAITLKNLALCYVNASATICSALLQHILTPPDMKMRIIFPRQKIRDRPLLAIPILSKLSGETTLSPPAPLTGFSISYNQKEHSGILRGWRSLTGFKGSSHCKLRDITAFEIGLFPDNKPLADILTPWPLDSVQELHIKLPLPGRTPELSLSGIVDLAMLSDQMPNVTMLMLECWPLPSCVDVLCNPFLAVSGNGFAWPSLDTLLLKWVEFASDHSYARNDGSRSIAYLRDGLVKRQASGCSMLGRLIIRKCDVEELDLSILQGCYRELIVECGEFLLDDSDDGYL
ncbi:hypothetical protein NM688_g4038 [Phlebia brevispora]|uniref:Uncharacterized protein n=1 Tax=Phlebia brevispora TaxID=194682 RepID=A0ACC1T482_9APHY|nr:hypothetical protein NM688_g4038 [Phlebia brevispora]